MAKQLPERHQVARLRARRQLGPTQPIDELEQMARLDLARVLHPFTVEKRAKLGQVARVRLD